MLLNERKIIPQQLRQTIIGCSRDVERLSKWQMAQNIRQRKEQCKTLKPSLCKETLFQLVSVVEPNKEEELDFAGSLPDKKKVRIF